MTEEAREVVEDRRPKPRATYEDLESVPPNKVGEIVYGRLYVSPRPSLPEAAAMGALFWQIYGLFHLGQGGPGGWVILREPELHLGGDALVPDLVGWRRERMPEMPDVAAFTLVPDWVCEVLSDGSAPLSEAECTEEKQHAYAREGVKSLWRVDPWRRTLEVHRLEEGRRWSQQGTWSGEALVRAEPFEAVELRLGLLWGR